MLCFYWFHYKMVSPLLLNTISHLLWLSLACLKHNLSMQRVDGSSPQMLMTCNLKVSSFRRMYCLWSGISCWIFPTVTEFTFFHLLCDTLWLCPFWSTEHGTIFTHLCSRSVLRFLDSLTYFWNHGLTVFVIWDAASRHFGISLWTDSSVREQALYWQSTAYF